MLLPHNNSDLRAFLNLDNLIWSFAKGSHFDSIKQNELINMYKMIGRLIKSGLSIDVALSSYNKGMTKGILKEVIARIIYDIQLGISVVDAFNNFNKYFPPLLILSLETCMHSGNYGDTFITIAKYFENLGTFTKKSKRAMVYPMLLWGILCLIFITFKLAIVPILIELNIKLPSLVKWQDTIMLLFSCLMGMLILLVYFSNRFAKPSLIHKIPFWGYLYQVQENYLIFLNLSYLLRLRSWYNKLNKNC